MLTYQPGEIPFPSSESNSGGLIARDQWMVFSWDLRMSAWDSDYFFQMVLASGAVMTREGECNGRSFSPHIKIEELITWSDPRRPASDEAIKRTENVMSQGYEWVCSPFLIDLSSQKIPYYPLTMVDKYADSGKIATAGDLMERGGDDIWRDLYDIINSQRFRVRTEHEVNPDKTQWWYG